MKTLKFIKPIENLQELKRLYIMDSSFNPPTNAHLEMLQRTPHTPSDGHLLLLASNNADKLQENFSDRIKLLESLEFPSATIAHARFVDKAKEFDIPTTFILGYDTVVRFFDKKYYSDFDQVMNDFFGVNRLWVVDRGNNVLSFWERPEIKNGIKFKESIDVVDRLEGDVSSTLVRNLLKQYYIDKDPALLYRLECLVPAPVLKIILYNEMYKI
jgi:nicotinic acid mononucleotide adenylyltransferase